MTSSLVGSEMCIRDRPQTPPKTRTPVNAPNQPLSNQTHAGDTILQRACLLYTSDAADDMQS
eukprot:1614246-Prorocentrum_lima.AAC.1